MAKGTTAGARHLGNLKRNLLDKEVVCTHHVRRESALKKVAPGVVKRLKVRSTQVLEYELKKIQQELLNATNALDEACSERAAQLLKKELLAAYKVEDY